MHKAIFGLVVVAGMFVLAPTPAHACGDKIVDMSRGVRFQRACAVKRASVLMYLGEGGDGRSLLVLRDRLARVGHQVEIAKTTDSLNRMLQSTRSYDIVIAPEADTESIKTLLSSMNPAPLLIPAVPRGHGEVAGSKKAQSLVILLTASAKDQILTIDEAIKSRTSEDTANS